MQLLERVYIIFWLMDTKLMMIDFQLRRTNLALQEILTNQYINRDGNGVAYTIGEQKAVDDM